MKSKTPWLPKVKGKKLKCNKCDNGRIYYHCTLTWKLCHYMCTKCGGKGYL